MVLSQNAADNQLQEEKPTTVSPDQELWRAHLTS